jgi:two-component system, OmpR family, response regulator ResD
MSFPHNTKILLIDDDPFILDIYNLKFTEQGFLIHMAHNGKEGIEEIKSFKPDLVLLDIVMPTMDGFDVMRNLTELRRAQPFKILFLTNFGQKEDVERGMHLGADGYIIKAHFTPSEVVTKVKQMLGI